MAVERIDTPVAHLPPHDLEAEQSVLGAMLVNPNAITAVAETLAADDFYRDSHRLIYRAVLALFEKGEEVDVVTLSAQLEREGVLERAGGREFVHTLAEFVPAAANAAHYAGIVREQSVLRALIRVGNEIAELGYRHPGDTPDLLDRCEQKVFAIQQQRRVAEFQHIKEVLIRNFEYIDSRGARARHQRRRQRLRGHRQAHRRLPEGQPHRPRRAPRRRQDLPGAQHRPERRRGGQGAGRHLQPRDERPGAGRAHDVLVGARELAQGAHRQRSPATTTPSSCRRPASSRRPTSSSTTPPASTCSSCAPRRGACRPSSRSRWSSSTTCSSWPATRAPRTASRRSPTSRAR